MAKIKTKKAAAKRFRIGGRGRVIRGQAGLRHNTGKKRPGQAHRLRKKLTVDKSDMSLIKPILPYRNRSKA